MTLPRILPESRAFHAFIEPARPGGAWWRVLIGLSLCVMLWLGFGFVLVGMVANGALAPLGIGAEAGMAMGVPGRRMPPEAVLLFLLTFTGLWIGLWVAVRLVHRRRFRTLFSPGGRPQARPFLNGACLALGFHIVSLGVYTAVLGTPERTALPVSVWSLWLAPVVLAIIIQATSEELLFRGYILQHFAVWSRHPFVWAVVPAALFAILHYDAGMEAGMRWRMLVHILIIGVVTAALVWRTGGLGAAAGLHVANNIVAICGFGITGSAFGFELWVFPADTMTRMFAFDLTLGMLMLAGVFILFRTEPHR